MENEGGSEVKLLERYIIDGTRNLLVIVLNSIGLKV